MHAGGEEQEVRPGTLVFVPPATPHAIRNIGEEPLAYVSASSPPVERPPADAIWTYQAPPTGQR